MFTVICPYCKIGVGILFNECLHELIIKNKSTCKCTNCNKSFIVYNDKTKIETKKKDDDL